MRLAFTAALLVLFGFPQVQADQVMSTKGTVVLTRNQEQFQARTRAYLKAGDQLTTPANGGCSFALDNGSFCYTGPSTTIRMHEGSIFVVQGEVRVLSPRSSQLVVGMPQSSLLVNGGSHRIGVDQNGCRIVCEQYPARLQWYPSPQAQPQAIKVVPNNPVQIVDGQPMQLGQQDAANWNIDIQGLQQQSIAQAQGQQGVVPRQFDQDPRIENQPLNDPSQFQNLAQQDPLQQPVQQPTQDPTQIPYQAQAQQQTAASDAPPAQSSADQGSYQREPDTSASQSAASIASAIGGVSAAAGLASSGAGNTDANQATLQGMLGPGGGPFPGNIHLVTSDTAYGLADLCVSDAHVNNILGGSSDVYFSIGDGALPTSQVSTDFSTGSNPSPNAIAIPGTNSYVLQLDQYGVLDPRNDNTSVANTAGITGLLGDPPSAPNVVGATPHVDARELARMNDSATFALGEFRLGRNATTGELEFAVRQSDQDRIIVKDPGGNDANDVVTTNPDLGDRFTDLVDPRFLPAAPTVKVPEQNGYRPNNRNFSELNNLRRAAATVVLADQLYETARATGKTRFAIDGKIIDISGYQK